MLAFCSCTSASLDAESNLTDVSEESEGEIMADPRGAAAAIYFSLEESDAEELDDTAFEEIVGIRPADTEDFCAYYSNVRAGLADVIIVKAKTHTRDSVRERLYKYKEKRISEFENYDILNAYNIALNAVVYDQNDYVILLMLEDNDAAKLLIDEYIPQ